MFAQRRLDHPIAASCSERISRLAAALDPASFGALPFPAGLHVGAALSGEAPPAGDASCIFIYCGHAGELTAPFHPCYRVHTALAPLAPLMWEPEQGPAIRLSVQVDPQLAAELLLELGELHAHSPMGGESQAWLPLDAGMAETVLRLLRALPCAAELRVLGPGIVREFVYRALAGPQGALLRAALGHPASMRGIGKALHRIRTSYAEDLDVAALADEAGMSVATFHAHFKAFTHTTPIQFLKQTRLQQARLLMMREGLSAAHASQLVGYESSSQFSREFKRLFGRTPTQEATRLKASLRMGATTAAPPTRDMEFSPSIQSHTRLW
ncbi:hypothetical protein B0920_12285 [Massilia sp. KIM]|uniref:helix-turn-helix transcriptional regulator n=1 Tax=Massilia sp. KIM TaxID=1955422 RepID=UPI0009902AF4|nr:helix-turn-helix domain-containing protein [Massilia sp. KIM]OON64071.1 hypothetical protein B0920_12285 [Massilia sp. KIM]